MHRITAVLAVMFLGFAGPSLAQAADPPIVDTRGWEELLAESIENDTMLITMVTSAESRPCQTMRDITLQDGRVESWFERNAVLTTIYEQGESHIYEKWNVQAFPTFIAWHKGQQVDRVIGGQTPEVFLAWLDLVLDAAKPTPLIRGFGSSGAFASPNELAAETARLIEAGENDTLASEHIVWLWKHLTLESGSKPDLARIALFPMMADLAQRHEPTRAGLEELRSSIPERALAGRRANPARIADYIVLSRAIGDQQAALDWYDRSTEDPTTRAFFGTVRHELAELLIEAGRADQVPVVVPSPAGAASGLQRRLLGGIDADDPSRALRVDGTRRLLEAYRDVARSLGRDADLERIEKGLKKISG